MDSDLNQQEQLNQDQGGAVYPKQDCPHFNIEFLKQLIEIAKQQKEKFAKQECNECRSIKENWYCLQCGQTKCSRYVKAHMSKHYESIQHPITLSFSDGSFWCYQCDSYITNKYLGLCRKAFEHSKFENLEEFNKAITQISECYENYSVEQQENQNFKELQEKQKLSFKYEDLVNGIKENKFKKIVVLTGAGISVSSGIPDFRSPNTGIYDKLKDFKLPTPEKLFELEYFKGNPKPFYIFTKSIFEFKIKPTINHYFIKQLLQRNQLLFNYTQNIDGLELEAGIPQEKIMFAHGSYSSAKCAVCKKDASIDEFFKNMRQDTIYQCQTCQGPIKPSIVFFGERLPLDFFKNASFCTECDLAIVMGTSLQVQPFASLIGIIDEQVPMVLINKENSVGQRYNFLHLEGDIDTNVEKLIKDIGIEMPNIQKQQLMDINFEQIRQQLENFDIDQKKNPQPSQQDKIQEQLLEKEKQQKQEEQTQVQKKIDLDDEEKKQ